jgi:hypothetical protein
MENEMGEACGKHGGGEKWRSLGRLGVDGRAVESESEGILGGVGVSKNAPTPTPTSI